MATSTQEKKTDNYPGMRVRQARTALGMTQEELAQAARIGRITLTRIETGIANPRYATLLTLAQALGVSVEWIESGARSRAR